jgi:3-phenylpropionate/trans-cinnamate dioxygenase ferredoxin subunit
MTTVRVSTLSELTPNLALRVDLPTDDGEVAVCVVLDDHGAVHAIGDLCSHGDISLADGFVEDCTIECWAHGSKFDLRTGIPLTLPAYEPVPVYEVTITPEGDVLVDPDKTISHKEA